MAKDPSLADLPEQLQEVLRGIPNRGFASRLEKVYLAAANAVARLTDIDLLRYESNTLEEGGSADLSLWEVMAPVIRDTVMDVNALLTVIRATFPQGPAGGLDEILANSVEEPGADLGTDPASRLSAAERWVAIGRDNLAGQVTKLGETIRSPSVMSDRWNLLAELQTFRSQFRDEIGMLVFKTASAFAFVQRREVVPGHSEQIKAAIQIRATVTDLARVLAARKQKVSEAEPEDVQWNAQQLEKEMDSFGKTPAYRALRAQDKRALIEFRQRLRGLLALAKPTQPMLQALVGEYAAFIQGLVSTLSPELLKENDLEVFASVGVRLEQAQGQAEGQPDAAARVLAEAVAIGQGLYGRDDKLDGFLRKARKSPLASLQGPELLATIEVYRELLANLPAHEG